MPSARANGYKGPNSGFFVGDSPFTWGRAVYVTGIEEPLSTAIYGRVGIVARVEGDRWRCFDARRPDHCEVYLRWLHAQPTYAEAVLTVHPAHWLQTLRNHFREQFAIDVVLFGPDEVDRPGTYTIPADTWLAVSEWTSHGTLAMGYASRFRDARMTILIEEEFAVDDPGLTRSPLLSVGGGPPRPGLPARVRNAYATGQIERVTS